MRKLDFFQRIDKVFDYAYISDIMQRCITGALLNFCSTWTREMWTLKRSACRVWCIKSSIWIHTEESVNNFCANYIIWNCSLLQIFPHNSIFCLRWFLLRSSFATFLGGFSFRIRERTRIREDKTADSQLKQTCNFILFIGIGKCRVWDCKLLGNVLATKIE